MKTSTEAWLLAADDDLMAIESLLTNAALTHIVAFHAQQAIEKSMKAVFEEFEIPVIRTHNIETLFIKIKSEISIDLDERIVAELDRIYLDARYPGDYGLMPYGKPTPEEARNYYEEAKSIRSSIAKELIGQ
jgi:HEPN domain-containing protein